MVGKPSRSKIRNDKYNDMFAQLVPAMVSITPSETMAPQEPSLFDTPIEERDPFEPAPDDFCEMDTVEDPY